MRCILKALHAEEINLQAARKLIELIEDNPAKDVNTVRFFEIISNNYFYFLLNFQLIKEQNLQQISDIKEIEKLCQQAIEKHSKAVKAYHSGKTKAMFAIVGEVAKISNEKANMKMVTACLEKLLAKK